MSTITNLLGFLSTFALSTGMMFKIFHWPYAGIIMFIGFFLLNFGFLPLFFIQRNKRQNEMSVK